MKTLFHDDVLRFLYSREMFQQLQEEEQIRFLERFGRDEQFIQAVEVALTYYDQLGMLESVVPEIQTPAVRLEKRIKEYVKEEDNISYFPFGEKTDKAGPLLVVIDLTEEMQSHLIETKGLLMLLLELCTQQQRDCIVLAGEEQIIFPHGKLKEEQALKIHQLKTGQWSISVADMVQHAQKIVSSYVVKQDAEIMFITAGSLLLSESQLANLRKQNIEISAVAFNHALFMHHPIQVDKVFFPNEDTR